MAALLVFKDFIPLIGSALSLFGTLGAGLFAWNIYKGRLAFDEWEKTRAIQKAEIDARIQILASIYPKASTLVRYFAEMDLLLKFDVDVFTISINNGKDLDNEEARCWKIDNDPRNDEIERLIETTIGEIVSSGYVYGSMPFDVAFALGIPNDNNLGSLLENWSLRIKGQMDQGYVKDKKAWLQPWKTALDECLNFEIGQKKHLLEVPYPLSMEVSKEIKQRKRQRKASLKMDGFIKKWDKKEEMEQRRIGAAKVKQWEKERLEKELLAKTAKLPIDDEINKTQVNQ